MGQMIIILLDRKNHRHLCNMLVKHAWLESNHKEGSNKPKLKDILQFKWPIIFKNVKVMKVEEILRNCFGLKETKETWQLLARYDSERDEFTRDLFIYFRKVGRGRGRRKKNLKQTPHWVQTLTRGSISPPWDHDLSREQESDAQPTEPPRHP